MPHHESIHLVPLELTRNAKRLGLRLPASSRWRQIDPPLTIRPQTNIFVILCRQCSLDDGPPIGPLIKIPLAKVQEDSRVELRPFGGQQDGYLVGQCPDCFTVYWQHRS